MPPDYSIVNPQIHVHGIVQQSQKIHPKSVDEILKGTSFIPVCSSNYIKEISEGKVLVFVYNQGDGIGYRNGVEINFEVNKAMAKVLRISLEDFPERDSIKFLKFDADCDPTLAVDMYQKLTEAPFIFPTTPYITFFKDGKKMTETSNIAPTFEKYLIEIWVQAMRRNLKIFLTY